MKLLAASQLEDRNTAVLESITVGKIDFNVLYVPESTSKAKHFPMVSRESDANFSEKEVFDYMESRGY